MILLRIFLFALLVGLISGCTVLDSTPLTETQSTPPVSTTIVQAYATKTPGGNTTEIPLTATLSENLPSVTTTETPISLTGQLSVSSIPEGVTFMILEAGLSAQTPYSTVIAPDTYTLTFSSDGYRTMTQTVSIVSNEVASLQVEMTYLYEYIPLEVLADNHLTYIDWAPNGYTLIYAVENGFYSTESVDWTWWSYDSLSGNKIQITPPDSRVDIETRQQLNLCPLQGSSMTPSCSGYSLLFESQTSDIIVFTPLATGDGEAWLATINGDSAQKLDDIVLAPSYVQWSNNERWLIISIHLPALPGQHEHYLVSRDGTFIKRLAEITGHYSSNVNGLFPQFSPDGQTLAYAGSEVPGSHVQSDYKLYTLNLDSLETRLVSSRLGLFQWGADSSGLYVLDGALYPLTTEDTDTSSGDLGRQITNLYYIDLTKDTVLESQIASNIFYFPKLNRGTWLWGYSEESQAIAYVGFEQDEELGILFLSPLGEHTVP